MQVFRIWNKPDRVIAFDELPKRFLSGFEMATADGFPRHWKDWMGKTTREIKIPPEKDPLTGQIRHHNPIVEQDCYFYVVDKSLNPVMDKWKEIQDFVRRNGPKDQHLPENLEDIALPLAANQSDGVTLEPEDVPIIKIPIEAQEKEPIINPNERSDKQNEPARFDFKCGEAGCNAEFEKKQALRMHLMRKHSKEKVAI